VIIIVLLRSKFEHTKSYVGFGSYAVSDAAWSYGYERYIIVDETPSKVTVDHELPWSARRPFQVRVEGQKLVFDAAKIACTMMITMAIEAMAEAVVLTEANGLPRDRFFELILGTLFGSRSYQVYSGNIANPNYEPGFKATLGLKDLRLAREAAEQVGRTLPMLDAVHRRMAETVDAGMGDRDWSVMADFTIKGSNER
jgi:NAD-binding of NADP-dependent 3-hydroxyisobutyrate dehydrogenase